jgi:hypothetical protein
MSNTTILVNSKTRKLLGEVGRKNQTYDQIILELIKQRINHDSTNSSDWET